MDWDVLNESRKELTAKLALKDTMFDILIAKYVQNDLGYHNLHHIADSLEHYDRFKYLADYPLAVQTAIWFHDAIYITRDENNRGADNELKSAELAEQTLVETGLPQTFCRHVYDIIVGAVYKNMPTDKDVILMRDIDLSILGRRENIYHPYSKKVRAEYWQLSDDKFAVGRKKFLEKISAVELFITKEFKELYEAQAKKNISEEIRRLDLYLKSVS